MSGTIAGRCGTSKRHRPCWTLKAHVLFHFSDHCRLASFLVSESMPSLLQEGVEEVRDGAKVGGRVVKRFIPFSEGSRDCVGQSLARLNLTTTLAQLFGSFSFRLDESVRARSGVVFSSAACCLMHYVASRMHSRPVPALCLKKYTQGTVYDRWHINACPCMDVAFGHVHEIKQLCPSLVA